MAAAEDSLPLGTIVFVHGLQKRPELDYHVGCVCRELDAETGRYGVRLHGAGLFLGESGARGGPPASASAGTDGAVKPLAFKPANLQVARAAAVVLAAEKPLWARPSPRDGGGGAGQAAQESLLRRAEALERGQLAAQEADGGEPRAAAAAVGPQAAPPQTREHRLMCRLCAATTGRGTAEPAGSPAAELPASFAEIVQLLSRTSLPRNAALSAGAFLLMPRARIDSPPFTPAGATAISVSADSHRGDFPLHSVLSPDANSWYISGQPRPPREQPRLTFRFPAVRRVSFMGVRIPPMPMGPLSVRTFYLEVPRRAEKALGGGDAGGGPSGAGASPGSAEAAAWERVALGGDGAKQYQTLDVGHTQEIAIWPPLETQEVRMVLTSSAENIPGQPLGMYYVGFA